MKKMRTLIGNWCMRRLHRCCFQHSALASYSSARHTLLVQLQCYLPLCSMHHFVLKVDFSLSLELNMFCSPVGCAHSAICQPNRWPVLFLIYGWHSAKVRRQRFAEECFPKSEKMKENMFSFHCVHFGKFAFISVCLFTCIQKLFLFMLMPTWCAAK